MSKDPSTKVGAVLAHANEIVSMGFNGFPRGVKDDDRLLDRGKKYQLIVHAEMNALLRAGTRAKNAKLYLYQLPPCCACAKHLVSAGISEVVFCNCPVPDRWVSDITDSLCLLSEAGIYSRSITLWDLDGPEDQ